MKPFHNSSELDNDFMFIRLIKWKDHGVKMIITVTVPLCGYIGLWYIDVIRESGIMRRP